MADLPSTVTFASVIPGKKIDFFPNKQDLESIFSMPLNRWHSDFSLSFKDSVTGHITNIVVAPCVSGGFLIKHLSKRLDKITLYFSLNTANSLDQYVLFDDGEFTISGLVVSADQALRAAIDFLIENGLKSKRTDWIRESDIPQGMHWLISEDFLD